MPAPDIDYARNIQKYEKLVARNKWQQQSLPKWWPGVKAKPIIISEGDSWFDFPVKSLTDVLGVLLRHTIGLKNFGMDSKTNVIDFLSRDKKLDGIFLRLERSGDHADELSAKQADKKHGVWEDKFPSHTLYTALQNKTVAKHLDAIVLSAGGNDMVNAVRHGVIQQYQETWQQSYDSQLLKMAAQAVCTHYLQAIEYRDEFAPNAKILCHSYAYAVQVTRGTTTEFDLANVSKLINLLLDYLKLDGLVKPLKAVGININKLGDYTIQGQSNLHKTFDKKGWPANPVVDGVERVHPERAAFIKTMLDVLFESVNELPQEYQAKHNKSLTDFACLDIRNEVQEPKFWADFIHLNSDGYKQVSKRFRDQLLAMLAV